MSRNLARFTEPAPDHDVARLEDVELAGFDGASRARKIAFAVGPTSLLFVVGPAGSGKSAVLDLLSFQALPSKGRLEVFGVAPARLPLSERPRMRRRVGLFDRRLLPDLDVFANVTLPAGMARRKARDFAPEASELLMWVGLGGRGSEAISSLTDGEKRRLCFARALINRPDLLIADEPTWGLGDKAERAILRLVREVNHAGTPVVFATRNGGLAQSDGGVVYTMPAREAA